ncbi:hypothetical protein EON80_12015, partial [bacterium]
MRVTLIDVTGRGNGGRAGAPATVFNFDGTSAPNSVVTGATGDSDFEVAAVRTVGIDDAADGLQTSRDFEGKVKAAGASML